MTILIGKQGVNSVIDLSSMTQGVIPFYDEASLKLIGSPLSVSISEGLDIGNNPLNFGNTYKLASGYENFFLSKIFNNTNMHPVWQDGSIGGDPTPSMRLYTSSLFNRVVILENNDDKSGVLTNPTYTNVNGANTRIFAIYLELSQSINDVYLVLTDIATSTEVYKHYLGDFIGDVERRVEFQTPIDAFTASTSELSVVSTEGDVISKADITNTYPWIAFDFKTWEDRPLGAEKQAFLVSTNDTIPISIDPVNPTIWSGLSSLTISSGLTLDTLTGSLINTSGKTILAATGSLSMQPIKTGGGGAQTLRLWSENSNDGISWTVNPNSLRVYQITDDGNSFTTSISFDQDWLNGQYLRFAMYTSGGGSGVLTLTPTNATVRGQSVDGFSAVWNLKED